MKHRSNPLRFIKALAAILRGRPRVPARLEDNALLQVILQRRSVRRFKSQPIPDDVFAAIMEAGRVAPSTVNLQTWSFITFDSLSWKETFGHAMPFQGSRAVIVLGDTHRLRAFAPDLLPQAPLVEYTAAVMNASLAAMNMNIAAEAVGVSSVMLSETGRTGLLDAGFMKETLCLPDGVFPLTTIVFGYPSGGYPPMPPRLPMDQVFFERQYREANTAVLGDWLEQMQAGYKASHLLSSFDAQLKVYANKFQQAEQTLREMVFGEDQQERMEKR